MHLFRLTIILCCICNTMAAQTNIYDSLFVGGRWRTYLTHLPTGYSLSKKYSLVLAFHGGGPLGYQSIQFQSKLSTKSDSAGFVLVYPEGVSIAGNRTWNAGGCCAPSTTLNIDDIGFVDALLNKLFADRPIDTTRVYATGFSNGALLCYRLANQRASRFAAIAPVAGDLLYYPWNPSRPTPIISFHSYQDQNIKYNGGGTIGATGTYFPPQDSILKIIASNYTCGVLKDTLLDNPATYDHFKYSGCACNVVIEQYVSYDGEHSWPGGLASGGTSVSMQFNATELMWQFFQNYTTKCLPISSKVHEVAHNQVIFPNPFIDKLNSSEGEGKEIRLLNAMGQEIWKGTDIGNQDFSALNSGIYLVVMDQKAIRMVKR
jgi:polyhydroxybutyrate depolymerase